jgi:hypothetical protein
MRRAAFSTVASFNEPAGSEWLFGCLRQWPLRFERPFSSSRLTWVGVTHSGPHAMVRNASGIPSAATPITSKIMTSVHDAQLGKLKYAHFAKFEYGNSQCKLLKRPSVATMNHQEP